MDATLPLWIPGGNDELRGRNDENAEWQRRVGAFSYQSLMPAVAGTPRDDKPGVVVWYSARWILLTPRPPAGDKPPRCRPSVYRHVAHGEPASRLIGGQIPQDRSPGHAFVPIADAGLPAHQGMTSGSCGLVQRIDAADSATPHPDPCGGQAPALHFLIPPSAIGVQFGMFRPASPAVQTRADGRRTPELLLFAQLDSA